MVECWCNISPPVGSNFLEQDAPILMMTVRVTNQRVEHKVSSQPGLCSLRVCWLRKCFIYGRKDVGECVVGLSKGNVGIVPEHRACQYRSEEHTSELQS